MLPVYKAISFIQVIEKGGRTEPWVILVQADNSLQPFVVKIFNTELIQLRDSVCNEVLGNVLAREFNLPVPNAALIDLDRNFVHTLRDNKLVEILEERDDRLKFGSKLMDGYFLFDQGAFNKTSAKEVIDIDNVFAFDNLIRNADRNNRKPNILIKSNDTMLIDHELGFEINEHSFEEFKSLNWSEKFYKYHIFYPFLKRSISRHKGEYFNKFEEYLRTLNINELVPYLNQMVGYGFSSSKHGHVINYLTQMKQNSVKFVNLMRYLIQ